MKRFLLLFGALLVVAPLHAQVQPVAIPQFQFFADDGTPLASGKVCTYSAGTTSPLASFTDSTGTVQNSDPVILSSAGRASIWFGPQSYKLVVRTAGSDTTCSTGSILWTQDNIPGAGQAVVSNAFSAITAATNSNAGTFAMSGNTLDLSAATLKSPTGAGAAPTTSGLISYDTTANKFVFGVNGATKSFALASSAACSAGQFVSSPATATAIAGCSAPSLTGSTCTNCTINGSSTFTGAITSSTIGSSTLSSVTMAGVTTFPGSTLIDGSGNMAVGSGATFQVVGNGKFFDYAGNGGNPVIGGAGHVWSLVYNGGQADLYIDNVRVGTISVY